MQRGSDKHNPKIDEELKRETRSIEQGSPAETRAQESRQMEAAGDDEPMPDARLSSAGDTTNDEGLTPDAIEARADLARALTGVDYPAPRETLIDAGASSNAPGHVRDWLHALPAREFDGFQSVWESLRGMIERRGTPRF